MVSNQICRSVFFVTLSPLLPHDGGRQERNSRSRTINGSRPWHLFLTLPWLAYCTFPPCSGQQKKSGCAICQNVAIGHQTMFCPPECDGSVCGWLRSLIARHLRLRLVGRLDSAWWMCRANASVERSLALPLLVRHDMASYGIVDYWLAVVQSVEGCCAQQFSGRSLA